MLSALFLFPRNETSVGAETVSFVVTGEIVFVMETIQGSNSQATPSANISFVCICLSLFPKQAHMDTMYILPSSQHEQTHR